MADVSIATVSRVLNKTSPVSEAKRTRVEDAVAHLGYKPNPAALSLLTGETGGIGVLVPSIGGEYFAELLHGIDTNVQQHGYVLMVSPSHRDARELKIGISAIAQRVDGLLVMAPEVDSQTILDLLPREVPVVFVNTPLVSETATGISFDNYDGMRLVVQHLIDMGHRAIDFISGPPEAYDACERQRGFTEACRASGLRSEATRVFAGDFSLGSGYEAAESIIESGRLPTAIVAANDLSAQGALSRLREAGIVVPQKMALAGFDDVPSARFMTPPLTTIHVPIRQMGIQALDWLVEAIRTGNIAPRQINMPVELIVRDSTTGYRGNTPNANGRAV